jgi:nucleotide-binding universal stress UspA family protein
MNEIAPAPRSRHILVALDASPHSVAALRAAAELAALMEAELEGLFIEDINLLRLCGLPFGQEIGSYSGVARRLDNAGVERQLRALADTIHTVMARITAPSAVPWRFSVRRGPVVNELLNAAQEAALVSLGRAGHSHRKSLGSTARALVEQSHSPLLLLSETSKLVYPLTAIYTGSPGTQRALRWLATLALPRSPSTTRAPVPLRVVLASDGDPTPAQLEEDARRILDSSAGRNGVQYLHVHPSRVLATLRAHDGGTLILAGEQASLLAEHSGPTIIVP